jgi:hypothetical protein
MKGWAFVIALAGFLLSACALPPAPPPRTTPSSTATGMPDVDAVIAAMLSNNVEARLALWQPVIAGCTTREGLGGPPKCNAGEAEGTLIEFLPVIGPGEGSTIRRVDVASQLGVPVVKLLGAYRVKADATREPEYPAGEVAIIFSSPNADSTIAVRVQNGRIVRLDYGLQPENGFAADGEAWLIKPQ